MRLSRVFVIQEGPSSHSKLKVFSLSLSLPAPVLARKINPVSTPVCILASTPP